MNFGTGEAVVTRHDMHAEFSGNVYMGAIWGTGPVIPRGTRLKVLGLGISPGTTRVSTSCLALKQHPHTIHIVHFHDWALIRVPPLEQLAMAAE